MAKTAEAFVEIMEETKKERAETAASWSIGSDLKKHIPLSHKGEKPWAASLMATWPLQSPT